MMTKFFLSGLCALFFFSCNTRPATDARALLDKSVQYHDPRGQWPTLKTQMSFVSERPNGEDRISTVEIDNTTGYFKYAEGESQMGVLMDSCILVPADKTCDNVKRTRNYYIYLWGLPMKLNDPDTNLDTTVTEEEFNGKPCYVLHVPYEEDSWYYYIDKSNYALRGYMFYKDEPNKKGEVIFLEDEVAVGDMRIPKSRTWYTTPDNKLLGTDILKDSKVL